MYLELIVEKLEYLTPIIEKVFDDRPLEITLYRKDDLIKARLIIIEEPSEDT